MFRTALSVNTSNEIFDLKKPMLFVIDFDQTIVNGHTHNCLAKKFPYEKQGQIWSEEQKSIHCEFIKTELTQNKFLPLGSSKEWKEILELILGKNHAIAIASFTEYGHIIPWYLENCIGLSKEDIKKIKIIPGLPDHYNPQESEQFCKNQHIAHAITETAFQGAPANVILIDDNITNINESSKAGYNSIWATMINKITTQHLLSLQKLLSCINIFAPLANSHDSDSESSSDSLNLSPSLPSSSW